MYHISTLPFRLFKEFVQRTLFLQSRNPNCALLVHSEYIMKIGLIMQLQFDPNKSAMLDLLGPISI